MTAGTQSKTSIYKKKLLFHLSSPFANVCVFLAGNRKEAIFLLPVGLS